MEETKNRTPKERFDDEMKQINKDIAIDNAPEKEVGYSQEEAADLEDQVEAAEKAMDEDVEETKFDKHVGTKKIEVTREQHLNNKVDQQRKEILQKFNQIGGLEKENLSEFQKNVIAKVLKASEEETLDDPVLKHLVGKKIEVAQEYAKLNAEIKEVQLMIIERMAKLATACTESKGLAKTYNRDILLYVQKNPGVLPSEESKGAMLDNVDELK